MSEDISPSKMKCGKCEYTTETEIPEDTSVAEKQQQLKFHREDSHRVPPQNVVETPPTEDNRSKVKFPQPGIDKGQPLEVWEYNMQMQVLHGNVAGQLISCRSKELQTSLQRITGGTLYQKSEAHLFDEMKKLVVRYRTQDPTVYVEEFLSMKQE